MRAAIMCVALGLASLASAEPRAAHVKMSATQAEIDDESVAPVRLPLEVDAGWRLVRGEVIDAAINGRRDKDVLEAFSDARIVGGVALELFIQRSALKWPGTYQVILQLTVEEVPAPTPPTAAGSAASSTAGSASGSAAGSAAAPPPPARAEERTTITINKVGPTLDKPSAVTIQVTSAFGHDFRTVTPLLLDETSNRGRLTQLSIRQHGVTLHDSAPTDTRVTVKIDPAAVDPGGQRALIADIVGDPPWGTSSGNLEINALQLDKPITVAFTIEHRRWSGYIALLFALGGLAGFVIRTWAKRVTDRLKLQQDASTARVALLALDPRSLPAEHKQLAAAITAIETATAREDDAALKTAIDAATALVTAVTATQTTQLTDQRALLVRYAAVPDLLLAAQIGLELGGYPEALASIEDALLERDVRRADRALTQLAARLAGRRDALKTWIERLAVSFDAIAPVLPTAPLALRTRWTPVTSEPIRLAATKKLMLETLEAAEPALRELDGHVYQSRHDLARLANTARTRLTNAPQLAAELAQAVLWRDGDLPAAVAQLAAALAAWSTILQRVLTPFTSSSNPAIAAAAESALVARNAGDYDTLFAKLDTLLQKPQGGDPVDVPAVPPPPAPERAPAPVPTVADVPPILDGALVSPTLRRTGAWLKALQVLTAYCVLPFGAWLAYHESFIGRLPELIAIAATGFITDFTADAAVAKLEGLKK